MNIRNSIFSNRFYPGQKKEIIDLINLILKKENINIKTNLSKKNILGGIVPHAGYIFSGYQAVHFFKIIQQTSDIYDTIIIINPNHTGYGNDIAVDNHNFWNTPLGDVELDLEFINHIELPIDKSAHMFEHSGEVMLPFLQYFLNYNFKIIPITIKNQTYSNAKIIAKNIKNTAKKLKRKILIIASSDFSHYVDPELGYELDQKVVDNILNFNSENIEKVVNKNHLSVCGYGPIMTLLEYSKLCNTNSKIEILKRGHSGEIVESTEVVDYISMLSYYE